MASFDEKFGADFVSSAPNAPGVYRFFDRQGVVVYVGKAKNLRRRLANYRNATRKRIHRKMRVLVRDAAELRYEVCPSEQAALLREGELIRELKPHYNVDGAYAFLYPSLGLGYSDRTTLLCFTTHPHEFEHLNLTWYGCFRSRPRVKVAFKALIDSLTFVAHRERRARLPQYPSIKGSMLVGLRQVPAELKRGLAPFLAGEDMRLAAQLSKLLLFKPRALRNAAEVQLNLKCLAHFFESDAAKLRAVREVLGVTSYHVAQDERDALFIRARAIWGAPRQSAKVSVSACE